MGPLIAAFVYWHNPLYPFMLAAAVYMLAAVLSIWNRFQYKNRKPRLDNQIRISPEIMTLCLRTGVFFVCMERAGFVQIHDSEC